jgi:hypothetical protein
MAQTLLPDIGIAGFTPAMLNLAVAGHSLKVIAVRSIVSSRSCHRNNIKTLADLKGKKVTISRFGSGSDIMTRVALRYWKLDPEKDVSFSDRQYADAHRRLGFRPDGRRAGELDGGSEGRRYRMLPGVGGSRRSAVRLCQLRRSGVRHAAEKWPRERQAFSHGSYRRDPHF